MTSKPPLPEGRTSGYSLGTYSNTAAKVLFPYKKCSASNYTPSLPNFLLLHLHSRILITTTGYLNDDSFFTERKSPFGLKKFNF